MACGPSSGHTRAARPGVEAFPAPRSGAPPRTEHQPHPCRADEPQSHGPLAYEDANHDDDDDKAERPEHDSEAR